MKITNQLNIWHSHWYTGEEGPLVRIRLQKWPPGDIWAHHTSMSCIISWVAKLLRNYWNEAVCVCLYVCPPAMTLKWHNIVLYIIKTTWRIYLLTSWCNVAVMTNVFLTPWRTFWRHYVFLTSWRTFWRPDFFLTSRNVLTSRLTFLRHDDFCYVTTYLWCTFNLIM